MIERGKWSTRPIAILANGTSARLDMYDRRNACMDIEMGK